MKKFNKGFTLSELLCYIVVFSMLISIITGYMIFVYSTKNNLETAIYNEVMFLEDTVDDIKDYVFENDTNTKLLKIDSRILLTDLKTNMIFFEYDKTTHTLYNGIESKSITFRNISLELLTNRNHLVIKTNDGNFNFIIEVDE